MKIMSKDNGVFEGISFEKRNNTSKDNCALNLLNTSDTKIRHESRCSDKTVVRPTLEF